MIFKCYFKNRIGQSSRVLQNLMKVMSMNSKMAEPQVSITSIFDYSSPKRKNYDDYEDELAELHEANSSSLPIPWKGSDEMDPSDEDTEDASEDGEIRLEEPSDIKEQIYQDKLAALKGSLRDLEEGTHPEYLKRVGKVDKVYKDRLKLNETWRDHEASCIETNYVREKRGGVREFEEKKIELRLSLINDLEEKKKLIEQERLSMDLNSDFTEVKPVTTRKLRRRPNDPVPIPEKRRKVPQSQVTFLLDDKQIDDDLKMVLKGKNTASPKKPGETSNAIVSDARIEDGKLFFEKRWFHRGQPIYVEGKEMTRVSAVISGISGDSVWVTKMSEQTKIRVSVNQLHKGKISIKRRA